jgi:L-amino acid N-acyltransferase YncA
MGLGETLCKKVIETASAEGAPELQLVVNADNRAAVALYSKLGFAHKPVPEMDAQFARDRLAFGHLRMVMSKRLTQS